MMGPLDFPQPFRHDRLVHTLTVIFPVFAVVILGYVLTWAGAFRVRDITGLTRYVFNIAFPVMLFDSMARVSLPESVRWSFLLAYYAPTLLLYAIGMWSGMRWFRHGITGGGMVGMSAAYSNTVFIGLPVITTAWGDTALLPLLMIIAVHSGIMFSLTTAVAESGRHSRSRPGGDAVESTPVVALIALRTIKGMVRNPVVGGLVIGLVFNVLAIPIPAPIAAVTGLFRSSALPAALFVTGASLRQYNVRGQYAETAVLVLFKLVLHPFLVWIMAALILRLPPLWTGVAVVTAAMPTGINASVFASKYEAAVAPVTSSILVTTALSILTLTVLLAVFAPPA